MSPAAGAASPVGTSLRQSPWWLRVFLLLNVVQDFGLGFSGIFSPTHTLLPLEELSPLNVRFISALYLGGGVVILVAALLRHAIDTRIALTAFFVITVLVLVMTIAYWDDFTRDGVPRLWMTTYVLDPVLVPVIVTTLGIWHAADPGRHRLTVLFTAEAVVLGAVGLLLLLAPSVAVDLWPWALTPLLARVYASFFLAFAAGAALSAYERRVSAVVPVLLGSLALFACTLAVSLAHLSRFDDGPNRWLWFGVHVVAVATFAVAAIWLLRGGDRRLGRQAVALR